MSNNYYDNQNAAAPGVVQVHAAYGEPVDGTRGIAQGGNIQPATRYSTAPYRPPKRRKQDSPNIILCSFEECKAFPMKSTGYCAGHSRALGLVNWDKGGRPKAEVSADVNTD